jgi:glycosyltransferase involved in cell wall biosynthesis
MLAYDLSIIIPVYNEEESLVELAQWIEKTLKDSGKSYEVIFIDDGSNDRSWEVIESLKQSNALIKGIKFSRNYGKSAALDMGFQHADGEVVITMDADLQDSPEEIPDLFRMIKEENFDLVSGWKKKRHDPISKTIPSKFFNLVTRSISGIQLNDFNCGLKAYKNEVVKNIVVYGEMHRYIPLIAKWNGFSRIGEKAVAHQARKYGKTKFGFERFIYGFLDLLSITFVSKFKKKPMHFFGSLGTLSFFIGVAITIWLIVEKIYKLRQNIPVRDIVDQPLFFLALVAVILGVQLFLAGFLGELLSMNSSNNRDYIISKTTGFDG